MRLGINYPWWHYGWDFGPPVEGWGERAAFRAQLDADLALLRASAVSVVRWFLLGDGIAFGVGAAAPQRVDGVFRVREVPRIDPRFREDFISLLEACARADLQLLPVLIGAAWAYPGLDRDTCEKSPLRRWRASRDVVQRLPRGYVKGGRRDILQDPALRVSFFERVLEPLLEASLPWARSMFAWELFNEPEWVTGAWARATKGGVSFAAMCAFTREGAARVARCGMRATLGFARPHSLPRWLARAGDDLGLGVHQIHHYPRPGQRLPQARAGACPVILGEFATRVRTTRLPWPWSSVQHPWRELPRTDQGVRARLEVARARGYSAAFPWSFRGRDLATAPTPDALLRELAAFRAQGGGSGI